MHIDGKIACEADTFPTIRSFSFSTRAFLLRVLIFINVYKIIPMEYIESICSLESELYFISLYFIRIRHKT